MSLTEKFLSMDYGPAPEDPKEALLWLDAHHRRFSHFIHGQWHAPAENQFFETADPSTTEKIADIAQGSAQDVDAAVRAARAALPGWQALTPHARARYLYALARQIQPRRSPPRGPRPPRAGSLPPWPGRARARRPAVVPAA